MFAFYYKQNLRSFFAFPLHLMFLFLVFRKLLKPNRRFIMKMYSDVRNDLIYPINHELRGNAVLDVTESAVALGASQMAAIV